MYFEDGYDSSLWRDPSYIDFGSLSYSLLSYRMLATLDSSAAYGDLLSSSLSLSYSDQDQSRPVGRATYLQADNLYKSRRLGESVRMSFRPFASDWLWSGSSLSWGLDSTIYGLQYDSRTLAFKDNWLSWDPASITSHNLSLNLAARPGSLTQSLTLTANLPPLLDSYSGSLALNAGIASLRVQSRMYRKVQGGDFSFDPVTTNLSLGLAPGPLLSDSLVYDTGGLGPTSNSTSLAWGPLNASLSERRTLSYKPVIGSGWIPIGTDQSFIPSDFALSFNPQLKSMPLGSAALASTSGAGAGSAQTSAASPLWSLGANIALAQSLLRFTESTLSFQLTASVNMADKFSLSVSSQSQNSAAWRYYAWAFASPLESAGISKESVQVNPLTDIWEALSIWDEASLHKSLFKLKGLSFRAAQDLHDWTLSAEVSTAPLYKDLKYSLNTTFTILLAWKDIQTLKSTVKKDSTGLSY